jgi:hypothetical protein
MSTIELETLTGLETDGRPARGRRGKIAKWLSAPFAAGLHLTVRYPSGRLGDAHGVSSDAAWPPDPVAFAMDFLRGRDDSLPTSNRA